MTRSTAAHTDHALSSLRTLLEVNAQIARERHDLRVDAALNEEVADTLAAVSRTAAVHRDELANVIREWEALARGQAPPAPSTAESVISPRDLIESWLAIKESSSAMYRKAAENAPSARLRRRLLDLAHEEEVHGERLRRLL